MTHITYHGTSGPCDLRHGHVLQGELESLRAASPTARSLPKRIYGAAALSRIDLIRLHVISPRRRKPAYEVRPKVPPCLLTHKWPYFSTGRSLCTGAAITSW